MMLRGVGVLDLTRLLPGGYCSQRLLQLGADVLKIEPPGGDPLRHLPGGAAYFETLHQGKRLLTLDLKTASGRERLEQEAAAADVLVEGFRPGVMERNGVGYAALSGINPRLVYCAIPGYGSTGPLARRAGHDLNYLARSGALSLMPAAAGVPMIPGLQLADLAGGLDAAFLIAAALFERERTNKGRRVEVSMTDVIRGWTSIPRAAGGVGARNHPDAADRRDALLSRLSRARWPSHGGRPRAAILAGVLPRDWPERPRIPAIRRLRCGGGG